MSRFLRIDSFRGQLVFFIVQLALLAGALLLPGLLAPLCWALLAVVTLAKYIRLARFVRAQKRRASKGL